MSRLIYLLIHVFVHALVLHWFVWHCISRLRNAAEMDPGTVTQMTADAFQVTRCINLVNVEIIPRI